MKITWDHNDVDKKMAFYSKPRHPLNEADLTKSHYRIDNDGNVTHKTCTQCSQDHGHLIWLTIDHFSFRRLRGRLVPQPQCNNCRGRK